MKPELALAYKVCMVADAERKFRERGNLEKSGHSKLWKEAGNTVILAVTYQWSSKAFDEEHSN
jgi:hypothetical protein